MILVEVIGGTVSFGNRPWNIRRALLMPQLDDAVSHELAQELSDWQSLGQETWASFPCDEEEASPTPAKLK